jgi:hydrogenase maturation protease
MIPMIRTLVIGFGNLDRADDGVAFHVVNAFRRRLGQAALEEDNTGLEELGAPVDSVFIGQLVPEMIDMLEGYDRVVFVDAHVDASLDDLYCAAVSPDEAGLTFTHHMSPATLLAFFKALNGRDLEGHLVSIRGRDFDFHRDLSAETVTLVEPAVDRILGLLGSAGKTAGQP